MTTRSGDDRPIGDVRTLARAEVLAGALAFGVGNAPWSLGTGPKFVARLGAAGATVAIARHAGLTWTDLGLDRRGAADGARWGAGAGTAVALGIVGATRIPSVRRRFVDEKVSAHGPRRAAYELGFRIPFETALAEELVFRSTLLGLALARRSTPTAVVASSVAFGLWHIAPTWTDMEGSAVGAAAGDDHRSRVGAVAGVVAVTSVAGAVLAGLRLRAGSVLAPAMAHAALNMTTFAIARSVGRRPHDPPHHHGGAHR